MYVVTALCHVRDEIYDIRSDFGTMLENAEEDSRLEAKMAQLRFQVEEKETEVDKLQGKLDAQNARIKLLQQRLDGEKEKSDGFVSTIRGLVESARKKAEETESEHEHIEEIERCVTHAELLREEAAAAHAREREDLAATYQQRVDELEAAAAARATTDLDHAAQSAAELGALVATLNPDERREVWAALVYSVGSDANGGKRKLRGELRDYADVPTTEEVGI